MITPLPDGSFIVPASSGDGGYKVNHCKGQCSCTAGSFGKFCKHRKQLMERILIENNYSLVLTDPIGQAWLVKNEDGQNVGSIFRNGNEFVAQTIRGKAIANGSFTECLRDLRDLVSMF